MPQSALMADVAKSVATGQPVALNADAAGNLLVAPGGVSSKLNVTAAAVIKASAGRINRISVIVAGTTSGTFTINDCATVVAATAANTIWTMAYNAAANVVGAVITLDFPFVDGCVVSAVPGGGTPQIAISYS